MGEVALQKGLHRRLITPEMARLLIRSNSGNRPIREGYVSQLARQMKDGRWVLNGETIVIGSSGRLLDGQHRLLAIMESGVAIDSYVACDIDDEDGAFKTLDSGHKRNTADWLDAAGDANPKRTAAALRTMWEYKHGMNPGHGNTATTNELLDLLKRHSAITNHRIHVAKGFLNPSIIDFISYAVTYVDDLRDRGVEFVNGVTQGIGLPQDDPRYALRQRLISNMSAPARVRKSDVFLWCVKSWNSYVQGKPIALLKVGVSEIKIEIIGFPKSSV